MKPKRLTIPLSAALHRQVKIGAAMAEKSVPAFLVEIISESVEKLVPEATRDAIKAGG